MGHYFLCSPWFFAWVVYKGLNCCILFVLKNVWWWWTRIRNIPTLPNTNHFDKQKTSEPFCNLEYFETVNSRGHMFQGFLRLQISKKNDNWRFWDTVLKLTITFERWPFSYQFISWNVLWMEKRFFSDIFALSSPSLHSGISYFWDSQLKISMFRKVVKIPLEDAFEKQNRIFTLISDYIRANSSRNRIFQVLSFRSICLEIPNVIPLCALMAKIV